MQLLQQSSSNEDQCLCSCFPLPFRSLLTPHHCSAAWCLKSNDSGQVAEGSRDNADQPSQAELHWRCACSTDFIHTAGAVIQTQPLVQKTGEHAVQLNKKQLNAVLLHTQHIHTGLFAVTRHALQQRSTPASVTLPPFI